MRIQFLGFRVISFLKVRPNGILISKGFKIAETVLTMLTMDMF